MLRYSCTGPSTELPTEVIRGKLETLFARASEKNRDEAADAALDQAAALVQPLVDQLARLAADCDSS